MNIWVAEQVMQGLYNEVMLSEFGMTENIIHYKHLAGFLTDSSERM